MIMTGYLAGCTREVAITLHRVRGYNNKDAVGGDANLELEA
jgi:hypothetical protein